MGPVQIDTPVGVAIELARLESGNAHAHTPIDLFFPC